MSAEAGRVGRVGLVVWCAMLGCRLAGGSGKGSQGRLECGVELCCPGPAPAGYRRVGVPCAAQPNPKRHQPATAPNPDHTRPKTRRPAHTHQPSGHPAPNAESVHQHGGDRRGGVVWVVRVVSFSRRVREGSQGANCVAQGQRAGYRRVGV